MSAEQAFTNAHLELVSYYRLKPFTPISKHPGMLKKVKQFMNSMITRVGSLVPMELNLFKEYHFRAIETIMMYTSDSNFPELRTFHDRLKTAIQYIKPDTKLDKVTILFESFIKGITYFVDQDAGKRQPIYHRLLSCGSGTHAFRETFLRCEVEGTPISRAERKERSARIERCYTERKIYDAIWKYEHLHLPAIGTEERTPQNKGHQYFMGQVESDFQTCFPDTKIEADVQYNDLGMPVRLLLVRKVHGVITSKEVYNKEVVAPNIYGQLVHAARWTPRQSYMKIQSFDTEKSWRPVDGNALDHIPLTPRPTLTSSLVSNKESVHSELDQRFGGFGLTPK